MKGKLLLAAIVAATMSASAQGYKDGIEYYKAGQYSNAITLLERNLDKPGTDRALSLYYLGQAYLAKGDQAKAKSFFEQGLAADDKCPYNYVGLGGIALKDGNESQAKDYFKQAQALGKKNHEITVDIARAYYNADKVKYAKDVDKYLEKAHKDSKNRESSIYILEGDRLANEQQFNEAAAKYEQSILFDPDSPEGYVKWTNVYSYVAPDFATQKLEELLEKNPNSALAQRQLAEKYYDQGKLTRAAKQYGVYMANPSHFTEDTERYTVLLYADKDYDQAVKVSKELLASEPNNFQVSRILVRSLADLKNAPEAVAAAKTFMENPAFKGRYNEGDYTVYSDVLFQNGDTVASIDALKQGLAQFPQSADMMKTLSNAYMNIKAYPEAAEYAEQAVKANKDATGVDYYYATRPFLAAASQLLNDPEKLNPIVDRGIALTEKAVSMFDPNEVPIPVLNRLALFEMVKNKMIANDKVLATANKMIALMDADPKNADPKNADNTLDDYVSAYRWIAQYYANNKDEENMNAAKEKQAHYEELQKQAQ